MFTLLNDNESGGGRSAGGNGGGSGGGFNTDSVGMHTGSGFDGGTFNANFNGEQWSGPFVSPAVPVQMEEMNWNKTKNNERRRSKEHSGDTRGRRGKTRWDEGTGNAYYTQEECQPKYGGNEECQNALNTQVEPGELNDGNSNEIRRHKNHQRQNNKRLDKRTHTAKQEFYKKDLMQKQMKLAEAAARKSKRAHTSSRPSRPSRSSRSIVPLLSISLAPPPPLMKLNKGGSLITMNGTVIPPLVPPLLLPSGYSLLNATPIVQGPVVPLSSTNTHVTPLMQTKNY